MKTYNIELLSEAIKQNDNADIYARCPVCRSVYINDLWYIYGSILCPNCTAACIENVSREYVESLEG